MATPPRVADASISATSTTAIFLVLRRMRAPLIVLISLFSVSVFGLVLIPGKLENGTTWHMSPFDAFYVMSYTATTIGFGEIPHPYTDAQRMWVTLSIYLGVIGWAYAIGTLLALFRDKSFRQAVALQRFMREVDSMPEPFELVAGFGQAGGELVDALDYLGRRVVVIDRDEQRVEALDLGSYQYNVPGLVGDARNTGILEIAGLNSPKCCGVAALTDSDEANLAIVMSAALLRPELLVIARATSPTVVSRMKAFGTPLILNPYDDFGDDLVLSITAPVTRQLTSWLMSDPDAHLPPISHPPTDGTWVIAGHGRFGDEMARDLGREGISVLSLNVPHAAPGEDSHGHDELDAHALAGAVGLVAATDNDVTNLWIIDEARRANPELFVVARRNDASTADLFEVLKPNSVLVPTRHVARDALIRIGSPLLWQFLHACPAQGDAWSQRLLDRLLTLNEGNRPDTWEMPITTEVAPAVVRWLADGPVTLGDLLADPMDRDDKLPLVALALDRGGESLLTPGGDTEIREGDRLLMAGESFARRGLETTAQVDQAMAYVMTGRQVGAGWLWRTLFDRKTAA